MEGPFVDIFLGWACQQYPPLQKYRDDLKCFIANSHDERKAAPILLTILDGFLDDIHGQKTKGDFVEELCVFFLQLLVQELDGVVASQRGETAEDRTAPKPRGMGIGFSALPPRESIIARERNKKLRDRRVRFADEVEKYGNGDSRYRSHVPTRTRKTVKRRANDNINEHGSSSCSQRRQRRKVQ